MADEFEARAVALAATLIDSYGVATANRKPLIHLLRTELRQASRQQTTCDPFTATILAVSAGTSVTEEEIYGRSRHYRITKVRHAIWVSLADQGFSSTEIAKRFHRDHTTVLNGLKKARANGVEHK